MNCGAVVFDGGILGSRPWTGVARAFLSTLSAYAARASHECVLLVADAGTDLPLHGVRVLRTGAVNHWISRQLALPRLLAALDAGLLHSPVAAIPLRSPCPVVATVHDLPWRASVRLDEPGCGARHRLAARLALRRAAAIVVPSLATRDALLAEARSDRHAPIHVVPHGVEPPRAPTAEASLAGPFLAFGDRRPRKNVDLVRRTHARAHAARPDLPSLRIIGPGIEWLDDVERDRALRSARGLIAVSLHEGFGLPVLEAFGHGVPVLSGAVSSLPEVAGDAALLVDPTDESAVAEGLIRIHDDDDLRTRLRANGLARAATMTPAHSAARWLEIHTELMA